MTDLSALLYEKVLVKRAEMRQNSLESKENYGFRLLINKVSLSYFPPPDPSECAISFACSGKQHFIEPSHPCFVITRTDFVDSSVQNVNTSAGARYY